MPKATRCGDAAVGGARIDESRNSDLFQAFPTITADEAGYVVEGSRVAVQFFARTRKPDGTVAFEVRLSNVLIVEHGRITRDETYFDTKGRPCS